MAVVTKNLMRERLKLSIANSASLRITPLPQAEDFDTDAVDLRLGSYFFVPRGHKTTHFCPGYTPAQSLYQEEYVPVGEYIVLPAHHTVLGATLEFIKLPWDMSGQILTKSSWARTFITIETAPWIHPCYRGCLTLEIANVSNAPLVLYPGVKIAQLVLLLTIESSSLHKVENTSGDAENITERNKISGSYIGPTRPEPSSALKSPKTALSVLGVEDSDMLLPYDEYQTQILQDTRYREKFLEQLHNEGFQIKMPE